MSSTPIDDKVMHGRQSWTRKVTWDLGQAKVRAVVERDSYDFQSRVFVEVFSPQTLQWSRLETLEGKDCDWLEGSSSKNDDSIRLSSQCLVDELLGYALKILGGAR